MDVNETPGQASDASPPKLEALLQLISGPSWIKCENGVRVGLKILDEIRAILAQAKALDVPELAKWFETIEVLKKQAHPKPVIIGVVGSTGSGKSSVLNAVLEQEALVPTSCMRACTATITELRYNDDESDTNKFTAEVHFIGADEWQKEMKVLVHDLGQAPDSSLGNQPNTSTDSGIALSKIMAVYPEITKKRLVEAPWVINQLIQHPSVKDVLGTVKTISGSTAKDISGQLARYIDSKEKDRGVGPQNYTMEFWPLIKVVKLFVRSPVLESGLVLVDLPGVADSNAARSAVASRYIEQTNGLWVVAPITRAVDDKTAQNLLGHEFRRQLQLDGTYSNITFVCSKTDDISVTEALKVMPKEERAYKISEQRHSLESELKKLEKKPGTMKKRISEITKAMDAHDKEIDRMEKALRSAKGQDSVLFAMSQPTPSKPRKRKSRAKPKKSRKRGKRRAGPDSDDNLDDTGTDEDEDEPDVSMVKQRISVDELTERLERFKEEKATFREERETLKKETKPLAKQLKDTEEELKYLKSELTSACVQWRNNYSKPAIQTQFAEGLRELDVDDAAERDEDTFDPDQDQRDYAEVASKLPVFCVSTRAYQKHCGRMRKDKWVEGFDTVAETGIPALRNHALERVRTMRIQDCQAFLNEVCQFLTSLMTQVVIADRPLGLSDHIKDREVKFLEDAVKTLKQGMDAAIHCSLAPCQMEVQEKILDKFAPAAHAASDAAPVTVQSWAKKKNEGGLPYMTYRATCVRGGVFKNGKGEYDFNEDLSGPLVKKVTKHWESVFSRSIPKHLKTLAADLAEHLTVFEQQMSGRPELHHSPSYKLVAQQTQALVTTVKNYNPLLELVSTEQKAANRIFKPSVSAAMALAYEKCAEEKGPGSFKRAKEHMNEHVDTARHTMFTTATTKVETHLRRMHEQLRQKVEADMHQTIEKVHANYMSLVEDHNIFKKLTAACKAVRDLLEGADKRFEEVLSDNYVREPEFDQYVKGESDEDDDGDDESEEDDDEEDADADADAGDRDEPIRSASGDETDKVKAEPGNED